MIHSKKNGKKIKIKLPSKIVLSIRGGVLQSIISNTELEVIVYDWDNLQEELPNDIEKLDTMYQLDIDGMESIY